MNSNAINNSQSLMSQMYQPRTNGGSNAKEDTLTTLMGTTKFSAPKTDTYVPSVRSTQEADTEEVTDIDKAEQATETNKTDKTDSEYNTNRTLAQQLKIQQAEQKIDFLYQIADMFSKQGISMARLDGVWSQIAEGNFQVSEAESAEAAESISEDGYWGVEQTSKRIFDFAQALTGGDADKAEEMFGYVMKGYEAAEKAWGGELPDIAKETLNATKALFDDWKNSANEGDTSGGVVVESE